MSQSQKVMDSYNPSQTHPHPVDMKNYVCTEIGNKNKKTKVITTEENQSIEYASYQKIGLQNHRDQYLSKALPNLFTTSILTTRQESPADIGQELLLQQHIYYCDIAYNWGQL